jgi:DNA-3-methyladenine glycosylase II
MPPAGGSRAGPRSGRRPAEGDRDPSARSLGAVALVEIPEPFDFELSTARFRAFGLDWATVWEDGALYRAVRGQEVRITAAAGGVDVEPLDSDTEAVVRQVLGVEFDLVAFSAWAAGEERIAPLVVRFAGYRPTLAPDPFEMLVGAITAQQVSLFAAVAIRNRLVERYGERVGRVWAFPARQRLAAASEEDLFALGFSRRKAEYVIGLARSGLDLAALALLPDDEVKAQLTALRGLGEWTADWFLARYLGRSRAWPAGDLALRKAVRALYGDVDVRATGARFEPFQNLTAHYLLAQFLTP